jgi:transcriptional regulator with XRE-family HTH domain
MTNSHLGKLLPIQADPWQAVYPPKRGQSRTGFHAFMLLPGLSLAFYAAALGRSRSSVATYRAAAIAAAQIDPAILATVDTAIRAIRAEDGLQMARLRGSAQLPAWSRLAIGEYRKRGFSRREIATAFRCSPGTVANVLQGKGTTYALFSGERRLSNAQQHPPGQWFKRPRTRD